jgi:hypothetical protein
MSSISELKIKEFLDQRSQLSLSLYMPTHRSGRDVKQNAIRFKNLLGKLKRALKEQQIEDKEKGELLDPLMELLNDTFFWNHQSDGLALFRSKEKFLNYQVPYSFSESIMVNNRFYLKPLIPLLSTNREFFLLFLNLNDLMLYQVNMDNISPVEINDLPHSMESALKYNVYEKQIQYHTQAPRGRKGRQAVFHGQGGGGDNAEKKKYIMDYFHQVDTALKEGIMDKNIPLLLMGAEYLIPLYQEANSYPNLIEKGLDKDPSGFSLNEIHRNAWSFMEPYFMKEEEEYLRKFEKAVGIFQASLRIDEIIPASYDGRVDILFIQAEKAVWGIFNPADHRTVILEDAKRQSDSIDLIDFAVVHTLNSDGKVLVLAKDKIPERADIAAVFRY